MKSNNKEDKINIYDYLVTQAVDVTKIGQGKMSTDFSELQKAEEKSQHKIDITKSIRDPQIKRAVSALKLTNPFKGF